MIKIFTIAGFVSLALAWAGPLPELAGKAFYGHMIMHMLVVAVAAPFLAIGLVWGPWNLTEKYPTLFPAIPAAFVELVIVWAWHAPGLHHFARHSALGIFLEQGMFFVAGIWVWASSLGGRSDPGRMGAGIMGLLLTSMHMTFLGALLNLSDRPLFSHHKGVGVLSTLQDQQLGGAIMLVVGGVAYLLGGVWLAFRMLRKKKFYDRGVVI